MSAITLQLPDDVALELDRVGQETHRSPESVAQEMIERMISLRKFDQLRAEVRDALGDAPPNSEADILDGIS